MLRENRVIGWLKGKQWLLTLSIGFVLLLINYKSKTENRLRSHLREYSVVLDSKLFLRDTDEKHSKKYLYFRVKEYPRLVFTMKNYNYDYLDKGILLDVGYGDTLSLWIRNDINTAKMEREVYGIKTVDKVYLDVHQVLTFVRRSSKSSNLFLIVILIIGVIFHIRVSSSKVK